MTRILIAPIILYRYAISPLLPGRCRFEPTCSAYAIEALKTHGPFRGIWLALRRLTRCHPVGWLGASEGYDPVPPANSPCCAANRMGAGVHKPGNHDR
ncbi:MAG: membrane protein insertion efficiency factor YidD [Pseudomonadota bacterium]